MMLPKGSRMPQGTADESHVDAGYTFMSGGSYKLKTGTAVREVFSPSRQTIQTNAQNFGANGEHYVLVFSAALPDVKDKLIGLSIGFMTDGDAAWEYESGKSLNLTAMTFSAMVIDGEAVANQQTIDLGSATLDAHIGNADLSGGNVGFDIVFAPNGGTFTINETTPLMSVDVWSY